MCHQEKLVLREQLWEGREQLQQQAEFCTGLGASACTLLWSASSKEDAVKDILADVSHSPSLSPLTPQIGRASCRERVSSPV